MAIFKDRDQGPIITIEGGLSKGLTLQITENGLVIISPAPELITGIKKVEKDSMSKRFKTAFIQAGASLLKYNLPEPTNMPEEAEDKIDALRQATWSLLASHRKKGLRELLIELSEHDLALLAEFENVPAANWGECKDRLAREIQQTIEEYRESRYRRN